MSTPLYVSDLQETDPQWALVEATLLLAYEQRTANLIAYQALRVSSPSSYATVNIVQRL